MGPPNIFQLYRSQRFVEKGTLSCAEKSAFWEQRIKNGAVGGAVHLFKGQYFGHVSFLGYMHKGISRS